MPSVERIELKSFIILVTPFLTHELIRIMNIVFFLSFELSLHILLLLILLSVVQRM